MATIVTHKENGGQFILLGAGFGTYRTRMPGVFFGSLNPSEESGEMPVALICDCSGKVGWTFTKDIEVVSVDGADPAALLESDVTLDQ